MSEERELTVRQAKVLFASRNVWRWSIVNMARRQSVAEHTYLVTVLGLCLYDQCIKQHSLLERAAMFSYLMQHDAEEALLGDIPATVKLALERRNPGCITQIKRDLGAEVKYSHSFDRTPIKAMAKIADYVEAFKFASDNGAPEHVLAFLSTQLSNTITAGEDEFKVAVDWARLRHIVEEFVIDA